MWILEWRINISDHFQLPFWQISFSPHAFGLKMSQDVFQMKIDQMFEGCEGVLGIADDIVIAGKSNEEHNRCLHKAMGRCRNTGLKLNAEKCKIKEEKIKFYGVVCGQEGIQPDQSKVSALKKMAPPRNTKELHAFLELTNYTRPFIPSLSSTTTPLRNLIKMTSEFQWLPEHQEAFDKIRNDISKDVILSYFNPDKDVVLQCLYEGPGCLPASRQQTSSFHRERVVSSRIWV